MVGGSSTLNLSLLSRGVGEITKNGHERIDVVFEPQDYYNFVDSSKRIYLPPIRPTYSFESPQFSTTDNANKPHKEIPIPKTFTTRKGALLLFSEDLAHKTRQAHHVRRGHHDHLDDRASQLSKSADEIDLRTVDDLAKYILSYGGQQRHDYDDDNEVYLKFVHGRRKRDLFNRQIRPGFSAKRYLSSWTKCWDDQVLEKVISKGYLTEKSLFYYNPLMPHLQRRLNDDMSHYPTPYKLMRSMLMSPGSLSGYTFYRVRPESAETIGTQDFDLYGVAPDQAQSIKVISTKDGVQREVTYASLDKKAQEEVLTDLLVKSAVHYAMKKQQEYFEDSLARAMDTNKIQGTHEGREITPSMPQFDMENAVDSLLDANKGKAIIETDFPEDKSQISERSGSMRTKPLKHKTRHGKERASVRSHTSSPASEDKEYIGNVPVVSFRDGSGSPSSVPQLPHIPGAIPLTPIGETSREQTTVIQLPPIGRDTETEDEWGVRGSRDPGTTTYTDGDYDRKRREERIKKRESVTGIVPSGGTHLQSSTESLGGPASVHSVPASKVHRTQWKGSQQSLKSYGSKRGPGSQAEESSVKGSVVIGPDGEPINVGGTIAPQPRQDHIDQFHDANIVLGKDLISDESEGDEPDEWRHSRRLPRGQRDMMKNYANKRAPQEHKLDVHTDQNSAKSKVSEKEIVDALSDHAQQIAANILSRSSSGRDLEQDVRKAASLWMETHPARSISRSHSVQDQTVVREIMDNTKRKSAGPTAGEYRELIKENLATALSNTSGVDKEEIPADAEVSPELIEALSKESVSPEDLEIVKDEDSGKNLIRSKSQVSMAMGGVKEGHIFVPVAKNGRRASASIPADRVSNADIGELDVINYGEKESVVSVSKDESEKLSSSKTPSVKSASSKSRSEKAPSEKTPSEKGSKASKSQPPSIMGESIAEETEDVKDDASEKKSRVSFKDEVEVEDEFQKAVEEIEQKSQSSIKSGKSGTSPDGKKSKASIDKATTPATKKKEEFVVGRVDYKDELKHLFSGEIPSGKKPKTTKGKPKKKSIPSPVKKTTAPPAKTKKPKKGKKKEESPEPKAPEESPPPEPPKEPTPPPPEPEPPKEEEKPIDYESERESVNSELKSEESFEFNIVRDTPSPSPPPQAPSIPSVEEEPEEEEEELLDEEDDEAARLRMISNKEARAAKRAAQAEKRKQEVEKRRKEREDQLRREKEEFERQQLLKAELEEERRRAEEQRRLRREQQDEEREKEEREEMEKLRKQKLEEDRERKRREDYQRKLEEMKKRQQEEEQRRHEEMLRKQKEDEVRRQEELEMLAKMKEEERLEYERQKKLEEEERLRKEEEEKRLREEEAKRAMEEARRLAEEMARKQAEMEARLKFNRTLQVEANGMKHSHDITRAFVFSYFELLQWLGLDIPEFELLKLNQY